MSRRKVFLLTALVLIMSLLLAGCGGPKYYTVHIDVGAGGTVQGLDAAGNMSVEAGALVTLVPVPAAGYAFAGWSGPHAAQVANNAILVNEDKVLEAKFKLLEYELIVNKVGSGTGNVTTEIVEAKGHTHGSTLRLTATADPGSDFMGWSGDVTGTEPQVTITMTKAMTVTAKFDVTPPNILYGITQGDDVNKYLVNLTFINPTGSIGKTLEIQRRILTTDPWVTQATTVIGKYQQTWKSPQSLEKNVVYWYRMGIRNGSLPPERWSDPYPVVVGDSAPGNVPTPEWAPVPITTTYDKATGKYYVNLDWLPVSGLVQPYTYTVYYTVMDADGSTSGTATTTDTAWSGEFPVGKRFVAYLTATDAADRVSNQSSTQSITVGGKQPFAPGITVEDDHAGDFSRWDASINGGSVHLVWEAVILYTDLTYIQPAELRGYNIYRREGSGAFTLVNTTPTTDLYYNDHIPVEKRNRAYEYAVKAVTTVGRESDFSADVFSVDFSGSKGLPVTKKVRRR